MATGSGGGDVVEAARRSLGPVGAFLPLPFTETPAAGEQIGLARRIEQAGYTAVWVNEALGGKDVLVQSAVLLAATESVTLGTAIANLWARPPRLAHGAAALLASAYPGRFVLGVGVGYPQQAASVGREFGSPLATTRDYLEQMADPAPVQPAPEADYPLILAANGPRMLALAAELTDGAIPAAMPASFTEQARKALGPDRLLVVALSLATGSLEPEAARAEARRQAAASLARPWYSATIERLGYSREQIDELDDELVDAIIAHGTPDAIAAAAHRHLAAGADHVVLLPTLGADPAVSIQRLEQLAPAALSGVRGVG